VFAVRRDRKTVGEPASVRRGEEERTLWESRRHAVVLVRPVGRGLALGVVGFAAFVLGWPWMLAAPPLLGLGALGAGLAVWRWERTRIVVTTQRLVVFHGTLRRGVAAVPLAGIGAIEVEQSLLGRALGYGTLAAGEFEVPCVPQPRELSSLVARLAA
jgi:membrane protein YdbS with pleckstrin-like domain